MPRTAVLLSIGGCPVDDKYERMSAKYSNESAYGDQNTDQSADVYAVSYVHAISDEYTLAYQYSSSHEYHPSYEHDTTNQHAI